MKIPTKHSDFLDNSIEDMDERLAMWKYSLYSFVGHFELTLEAKWLLLSIEQGRIQSEVKANA